MSDKKLTGFTIAEAAPLAVLKNITLAVQDNPSRLLGFSQSVATQQKLTGITMSASTDNQLLGFSIQAFEPEFCLTVQQPNGNSLPNAIVTITNEMETHILPTDQDGRVEIAMPILGHLTQLEIKKTGYQTYRHQWTPDKPVKWEITLERIVPVVVLQDGSTSVNLFPHEPENTIFS